MSISRFGLVAIVSLVPVSLASAQERQSANNYPDIPQQAEPAAPEQPTIQPTVRQGQMANIGNGEIGQRQSRHQAATNIRPLDRVSNRIANRVQNRLRNRIDPSYDPQPNATSPFATADEQTRSPNRD